MCRHECAPKSFATHTHTRLDSTRHTVQSSPEKSVCASCDTIFLRFSFSPFSFDKCCEIYRATVESIDIRINKVLKIKAWTIRWSQLMSWLCAARLSMQQDPNGLNGWRRGAGPVDKSDVCCTRSAREIEATNVSTASTRSELGNLCRCPSNGVKSVERIEIGFARILVLRSHNNCVYRFN